MIIHDFDKYRNRNVDEQFEDFFNQYMKAFTQQADINKDIFKQILELQVCVEGILHDQDEDVPESDRDMVKA